MNQHQHSLRCSATRHVGHNKKVLQMTTNHSASLAPALITASKSPFSLFLYWTAVAFIRLAYLYCNHLFAGLLQSLNYSGRAATKKITEACASSASRATTTGSGAAGAAHGAAERSHNRRRKSSASSVTATGSGHGSGGACTLLTRILRGALVLSIFPARGTHAEDAALSLSVGGSTSVNFLNFLQTTATSAHDDAAGMCRFIVNEEDISHDSAIIMPRLIPDGIPTERIHGNTVEIPSAQHMRPRGILSFMIEEDEEVSIFILYLIINCRSRFFFFTFIISFYIYLYTTDLQIYFLHSFPFLYRKSTRTCWPPMRLWKSLA